MSIKKTALYQSHLSLGAQMVEFAATYLPVRYESEKKEHLAVRTAAGMFDISHMGEFVIEGQNALIFLQHILTNDLLRLAVSQAQYSLLLNDKGGIIDDLIIYRLCDTRFLLCVNASNIDKDWAHIAEQAQNFSKISLENASDRFSLIAVQGPKTSHVLQSMSSDTLPKRFAIKEMKLALINALVARTGYTGEDGVEIFTCTQYALELWQALLEHGQRFGLTPCGLAARDSLRLEAGLLLYGQDIDDKISPLAAGLMFAVALNKGDFIGKAALIAQHKSGLSSKLVGFRLTERGMARHGFDILDSSLNVVGRVTSGGWPPGKDNSIGLAYIDADLAKDGQEIFIDIRGRMAKAEIKSI